jgi:thiamine kinase-like enzyme
MPDGSTVSLSSLALDDPAVMRTALGSRIPVLADAASVTALSGGLTNRNLAVDTPTGRYVVRVSDNRSSALGIDRDNEYRNSLAAAAAGVGAPVVGYLPGEGILVVGFLEGRTYAESDLADVTNLRRVASAVHQLHDGPRFVNDFNMFDIQRRYLDAAHEHGYRIPRDYEQSMTQVEHIRAAMAVREEPTVPCNNDLLAANFIDDGDRIWLIDYEYSGNNDPCFELGNIWSESVLADELLDELVTSYYGRTRVSRIARARLWALMGQYGWTLWGSIQAAVSEIDYDFWSWGMERYERATAALADHSFARLLEEVALPD